MRIAFFGTPEFAVPSLARLLAGPHTVALVVSQPDRPRGRGRKLSPSPVSQLALERGIAPLHPQTLAEPEVLNAIQRERIDLGIVVAFGQFVPKRIRESAKLGYFINGHASLLPKYRGAAPIQHAILAGERETGVSVMRLEREMDAGPTALSLRTPIGPEENAEQLGQRLAELCADAIEQAVEKIMSGNISWTPQDPTQVSYASKITRADAVLRWTEPAEALVQRIRAMAPKPGAYTLWNEASLRILAAQVHDEPCNSPPGRVHWPKGGTLRIATGQGWLIPSILQKAGGKPLERDDFLHGTPIPDGTQFETPDVRAEGS